MNPAASSITTLLEDKKGKLSPGAMGENHGRCEELGKSTPKNPSGYGERHVRKVTNGTGDTLLGHFLLEVKQKPISFSRSGGRTERESEGGIVPMIVATT